MSADEKPKVQVLEGIFEVHMNGDIYRLGDGQKKICRKIPITPRKDSNTYHRVDARRDGKVISRYAHVLYAQAFIENPDPAVNTIVRAKDGNLTNLSTDNLYWASRKDVAARNLEIARGKKRNKKSKRNIDVKQAIINDLKYIELDKLTPRQRKYMELRQQGMDYSEIAERLGVTRQAVHSNITRTIRKYYNREHRTNQRSKREVE